MQTRTPVSTGTEKQPFRRAMKTGSFGLGQPRRSCGNTGSTTGSTVRSTLKYLAHHGPLQVQPTKKNGYDTLKYAQRGDVRALRRPKAAFFGLVRNGEWKAKSTFTTRNRATRGRFGATGTGRFRHEDWQWDDNFFVQGFFPENLQSVLQSVAERQVRLRLPALPVRSAPRREHDVCQQPLLPCRRRIYRQPTNLRFSNGGKSQPSPPISNGTRWTPTWSISSIRSAIRY